MNEWHHHIMTRHCACTSFLGTEAVDCILWNLEKNSTFSKPIPYQNANPFLGNGQSTTLINARSIWLLLLLILTEHVYGK